MVVSCPTGVRALAAAIAGVVAVSPPVTAQSVPAPQPAHRPLDYSPRSGVTVRDPGGQFRPARTDLGASSFPPVTAPALWSGPYIGAHGGYARGQTTVAAPALGTATDSGPFGGVHLGWNWQTGAFVYGVEGDLSLRTAEGGRSFGSGFSIETKRDWTSSLRARAGYALGNALVYATAGAAVTRQTTTLSDGFSRDSRRNPFIGYAVGGGIEWKFAPQMSLRTEVLHFGFGERNLEFGGAKLPVTLDETVVRAGVTWHFN